jgi:hypothetical protein
LIADFVVKTETVATFLRGSDLTREERDLLLAVLTNPEALNRMCRLAMVCDLSAHVYGCYFEDTFRGPDPDDIFDSVLPYLSADLREYWTRLRSENHERFSADILNIFLEFRSSLQQTAIEDRTTGELIPLRIGGQAKFAA